MALTASGIGSGLDINSLVGQLMSIEQAPIAKLNTREASFQAKISAFGQIKSTLSSLQNAAKKLASADLYAAKSVSVSDSSFLTASASTSATSGSYSLKVLQLAQSQRVVSNATTEPTVGAGSLTINFGTYAYDANGNATGFSSTDSVTIDLTEGDTLEDLRDAINASGSNISASIVDNGDAQQLVIASTGEGAKTAFTLSGSGGLAGFSYDASAASGNTLEELERAQDAIVELGGLQVKRTSNTLTDVIDGVTLNLLKADPDTKLSVKVTNNNASATSAVEAFVKAYNEVNTTLRGLTAYDTQSGVAATLLGDATARNLQSQLRATLGSAVSGVEGASTLSALGIAFEKDGSLSFNKGKLESALNNPDVDVAGFFAGSEGITGFATRLDAQLKTYLEGSSGLIGQKIDSLNRSVDNIEDRRETLIRRLEVIEKRYRDQFTALDSLVSSMNSTSTYLTQQLSALSNLNKG